MFSVELIIDTIVVLREVNHVFCVFLIIDSIIVTCDLSNYVDVIIVSHQHSCSQPRPWAEEFTNLTHIFVMRVPLV